MLRDWPGQPLKDPQRIIDLVTTGQLKPLINPMRVTELHVRWENDELLKAPQVQQVPGEPDPMTGIPAMDETLPAIPVNACDNIQTHLIAHFEVLYSPAARKNPAIAKAAMVHIQEHLRVARMSDPMLAGIVGNPSPQEGMPGQDPGADGSGPNENANKGAQNAEKEPGLDDSKGAGMPKPAQPPSGAGL